MDTKIKEEQHKAPDRRTCLREPVIVLKVTEEINRKYFFGYAKNISRGGLFIASINPRKAGQQFDIAFQIPDTAIKVKCLCEVVWSREYKRKVSKEPGYGVRFLNLEDKVAVSIDRWISSQN
jgi:uncharacterized protein (TIGR02266 family)